MDVQVDRADDARAADDRPAGRIREDGARAGSRGEFQAHAVRAAARGRSRHVRLDRLPAGSQRMIAQHRHVVDGDAQLLRGRARIAQRRDGEAQRHIFRPVERQVKIRRPICRPIGGGVVWLLVRPHIPAAAQVGLGAGVPTSTRNGNGIGGCTTR